MSFCLDDGSELLFGPGSGPGPSMSWAGQMGSEPQTAILPSTDAPVETAKNKQLRTAEKTAVLPSHSSGVPGSKRLYKRLIIVPLALAVIVLGGFFGYRYITPAKQIESIAVMPFVNESGNADLEYLSDGMTDTLINNLSRIPKLSVKARSSVFKYKGKDVEASQVAADLNVQAVVHGRVLQHGDNLTLNLELVDAGSGDQIWGEQYVRKLGDLVTLQSDIARDVSSKLRQKLSGEAPGSSSVRNTENPEAYREYLKGRYHWNRRTKEDLDRSIDYFERAIEIDPAYALAYAGLADSYVVLPGYSNVRANEAYPKARSAAMKALEIDDSLAQAHATLGCVLHEFDWKFRESETEFKRAIELDPNYATAHQWYAELLLTLGRLDDSLAEIKRAQDCDPLSMIINSMAGVIYGVRGEYAAAEAQLRKTIEMDPNFGRAYLILGSIYEAQGKYEEAISAIEKQVALDGMPAQEIEKASGMVRQAYRSGGANGYYQAMASLVKARAETEAVNRPPYFTIGYMYARAGDTDRAFEYFEKSLEHREPDILRLRDPNLGPLHSDPRFQDLLRRIGLPQ